MPSPLRPNRPAPWRALALLALILAPACGDDPGTATDGAITPDAGPPTDGAPPADGALSPDAAPGPDAAPAPDAWVPQSCDFDYDDTFSYDLTPPAPMPGPAPGPAPEGSTWIAHAEPLPAGTHRVPLPGPPRDPLADPVSIVMPEYSDTMPLFPRGAAWATETRCYETPLGVQLLTEPEAFDLYRSIAELTTGVALDVTPERRSVVGVRGAYPGRFAFHGNLPDRFNDTLVLLWIDTDGAPHVREFAVNTDTGARDFGVDSSSSLWPNRRYPYVNGWHNTYNALHIDISSYRVRDDGNHNGHWDSDRNGWWPPYDGEDRDRAGSGHNIHMGSVDAPLGDAVVNGWSAGCQVIPGMASWTEFILNAWTNEGDPVDYFLVDVRDIDHRVWSPCTPDGTHDCPFVIPGFPFTHSADTSTATADAFDVYSCSAADESGPEVVYVFTIDRSGTLTATLDDVDGDAVDVDIHLLNADDPLACQARAHLSLTSAVVPGRYFLVADTYVDGGVSLAGPYTLTVTLD